MSEAMFANNAIARFEKVSLEEYLASCDCANATERKFHEAEWEAIQLPERATAGSAGYDFRLPYNVCLRKEPMVIPTGIRVKMKPGWMLLLLPRSGLGFKYGVKFANTGGVIDSDYYYANNQGHIKAKISSEIPVSLHVGERFMQGIFIPVGLAEEEEVNATRTGGFGSTGNT